MFTKCQVLQTNLQFPSRFQSCGKVCHNYQFRASVMAQYANALALIRAKSPVSNGRSRPVSSVTYKPSPGHLKLSSDTENTHLTYTEDTHTCMKLNYFVF